MATHRRYLAARPAGRADRGLHMRLAEPRRLLSRPDHGHRREPLLDKRLKVRRHRDIPRPVRERIAQAGLLAAGDQLVNAANHRCAL
jgi:hypothetical protein